MIKFEKIYSEITHIEKKIQNNCTGSMTPFKRKNITDRLDKIFKETRKIKSHDKAQLQDKIKELKKSARAVGEGYDLIGGLNQKCSCKNCSPNATSKTTVKIRRL